MSTQINTTSGQYDAVIKICKDIFMKKNADYGPSWRVLRPSSLTDQIFIKAQRIRTLEEKKEALVDEGIEPEFIGIINYCIITLIQLELPPSTSNESLGITHLETLYDKHAGQAKSLMEMKNHDYGEAWRDMRISTFTDMLLMRILRIKQMEDNNGATIASEGIEANFYDMINYAVFALIQMRSA
ncbi:MAG: DUF1599 domain-containing protein [Flavobacteriales bacterium]|nr:DUF1599 domain-containing protein [Flavobacteriales bacterium]